MKLLSVLLAILLSGPLSGQNVKFKPKFFTLHNGKLSLGAGGEVAFNGFVIRNIQNSTLKLLNKNPRGSDSEYPYTSIGITLDYYSANSILGFLGGVDFSKSHMGFQKGDSLTEYIRYELLEIPFYIKFRPGLRDGKTHWWLLLGGHYNIASKAERERFDSRTSGMAPGFMDQNKSQLSNYLSLASAIGYEVLIGTHKNLRVVLYSKASHSLGNLINSEYREFKPGGQSILSEFQNIELSELRFTIGAKILFRFGEALTVMTESLMNNK